ncbi:peptidase S41 [Candidatus Shapirobacteria bacterium CG_4_10_14_0_8_um_filter_39_15]|nr:MAG: peptidase S41 [Candidatus Shapirobacteria bacterium CG_4_10_14_0_8_um_filter_39_15]
MKIKMSLSQIKKFIIYLAVVVLAIGFGYRLGQSKVTVSLNSGKSLIKIDSNLPADKSNIDFSLFWQVWDRLEANYLRKEGLDPQKMIYGAISGMASALGDPYTVFLPPTEQNLSKADLAGTFDGVGIELGYKESKLAVVSPLKDSPAEKAGVKSGDFIAWIKDSQKKIDKTTQGMTLPEAVEIIRGVSGSEVILTLVRDQVEKPLEVTLKRAPIVVKSIELSFDDDKQIAKIKLMRFGEQTNRGWDSEVTAILGHSPQVKGIVLDLRNNPGGFLQGAIYIASEFIADGPVVKQENAGNRGTDVYNVDRKGLLTKIPLVVLINEGSASASEILSGALRERVKAKLVGQKSFGKGTVQEAEEFPGGSGLHITIARWLLPSGKSIDKEGITPDYLVAMDDKDSTKDPQMDKAIELLR